MTATHGREGAAAGRLTRAAGSLLSLAIVLKRSRDLDNYPDLRQTVDRLFHEFRVQARDEGVSAAEIDAASYALAAFLDEILLGAAWDGKEDWQRDNLAKHFCNNEFVGDGFFDKLTLVRRAVPAQREALEVFYYCLIAGFQGRMIESRREREDLIDQISREIGSPTKTLSPHGLPAAEGGRLEPIRRFPWPMVVLASILVPVLIWLLSWNLLDGQADRIVQQMRGG
jgi:type VI secretion system protein ImpK